MALYKTHFAHKSIIRFYTDRGLDFKNTAGTPKCGNINSKYQHITFNENEVNCQKCINKLNK